MLMAAEERDAAMEDAIAAMHGTLGPGERMVENVR
jgi:hypothetical protein